MQREYLVLRDLNADLIGRVARRSNKARGFSVPSIFGAGRSPGAVDEDRPTSISIETVKATPEESLEIEQQPGNEAVAELMPLALIEPVAAAGDLRPGHEAFTANGVAWGIEAVGATETEFDGESAVVAVLDTGIEKDHAAFQGITLETEDFSGDGTIQDFRGHGTHCAATVFGRDVDGKRIGIAPGVRRALIGKVFGKNRRPTTETLSNAIQWAVQGGANVISLSLSYDFTGMAAELQEDEGLPPEAATAHALFEFQRNLRMFDSLIDMLRQREAFPNERGVVLVAAAGNHSRREPTKKGEQVFTVPAAIPSNADGVISIGAVRQGQSGFEMASFSNSRAKLVAPGVGIMSARNTPDKQLVSMNGTSMACPHVAGLAALWWDQVRRSPVEPKAQTVIARLQTAADPNPFAPGVRQSDRGLGLAQAPK